jgi:hypothetical protein
VGKAPTSLAPVWVPALLVYCATGGDCSVKFGSSNSVKTPSLSEIRSEGPTTWQRANEGNAAAQKEMGVRYQSGDWVVQDDEQADMWFTLAADGGNHEAAVLRDELEKRMTPEQIAEARKRAQEWKPTTAPAI